MISASWIFVLVVGLKQVCGRESLKCCHMTVTMNSHVRLHHCAHQHSAGEEKAIGRRKDNLSTKMRAHNDVLGNPIKFYLTVAGQVHDLNGADILLDLLFSQT